MFLLNTYIIIHCRFNNFKLKTKMSLSKAVIAQQRAKEEQAAKVAQDRLDRDQAVH